MGEERFAALVGRDEELAAFEGALSRIESGHGWITIAEGEAGVGKTRLLAEVCERATNRGFAVIGGAGYELGHEHPYGAIADALNLRVSSSDAHRASIADLLRQSAGVGQHLQFRILDDVLTLVERLSIERPLLVTIDDLQWVDTASLLALAHVARHIAQLRAAMVCAVRSPPRRQQTDQFLRSVAGVARWVTLQPLSEAAVAVLLGEVVGGWPGARLLRVMAGTGGNPLFIRELADALRRDGCLIHGADTVELSGAALPSSIYRLVERRLTLLPATTVWALRMASLLGRDFTLVDLADALSRGAGSVAEAIEPALLDGLLGAAGERIRFRHQLVRDAIYYQMPQSTRIALHRDIGRLLARRNADVGQVASHLALGGDDARAEAVEWLHRAADKASANSPVLALEYLDRALELAGHGNQALHAIVVARVLALTSAGRPADAVKAAREALRAAAGPAAEARLRQGLARGLMVQGLWAESAAELQVLASNEGIAERDRARHLGDAALAMAHCGNLRDAVAAAEHARAIGDRLGDDLTRSIAVSSLAVVAHFEARHLDSVAASRDAVALAVRSNDPEAMIRPVALWLGLGLIDADEFDEALSVLQVSRRRSEEAGISWHLPLYDDGIGTLHFYAGEWDDATAEMETCISLARETGALWWMVPANCTLAYMAIHRDRDEFAAASISSAARQCDSYGGFGRNRLLWVSGLRLEAAGRTRQALALLEEGWAATAAAGFLPQHLTIGPDLVRIALASGASDRAREVASIVEEVADRTGIASARAVAMRCRGLADADAACLERAVTILRRSPRRVDHAFACEEAGTCLVRHGDVERGIGLLEEALDLYGRIGARRDAARVVAELQRHGRRRRRGPRPRRPALGWAALTDTEQRVAELTSLGLTNREVGSRLFISPRTVATHLAHVFAKLEIASRVELARLAEGRRRAV
jgi:DNA-binding CsgD family transcriptional regulator